MKRARSPALPELARLQHQFQDYVLRRDPTVLDRVQGAGDADAATRMNVYADGYVLRLLEALQTDYPGLKAIAGDDDFDRLGRAFIAAHRSTDRNLRWYGEGLARFLASEPPWSARPELADMARFEWAMAASFDALDAACLSRDALTGIDADHWPRLSFIVHPAARRVNLKSNVPFAWSAQARGEDPPLLHRDAAETTWLLTRRSLRVRFRAMAPDEAAAFDRLAARTCFAQWCGELGALVGEADAARRAVDLLNQWLVDGALAGFALEGAGV
jgi:hypothetical protein